jgi:hypothetical protein
MCTVLGCTEVAEFFFTAANVTAALCEAHLRAAAKRMGRQT